MTTATHDLTTNQMAFLQAAGWARAHIQPLSGDASSRRYYRLTQPGHSALLMVSPPGEHQPCPPTATAAERRALGPNAQMRLAANRTEAFVGVAQWLRDLGVSAPEILSVDHPQGLALVEDFGEVLLAQALETANEADTQTLYDLAADIALVIQQAPVPKTVGTDAPWPILSMDEMVLRSGADLMLDWAPRLSGAPPVSDAARADWDRTWSALLGPALARTPVMTLRDYHAENLMVLPDRPGLRHLGLLDFQDAIAGHPAWDLVMLVEDVRRDVPDSVRQRLITRWCDHYGPDLAAEITAIGAVNAVRIWGVFARLAVRDHKPRYLAFMPRVKQILQRHVHTPELAPLRQWLAQHQPEVMT